MIFQEIIEASSMQVFANSKARIIRTRVRSQQISNA